MDGVDVFDAEAFRLAGSEASAMDPQTRICLEQAQASATLLKVPAFLRSALLASQDAACIKNITNMMTGVAGSAALC